MSVGRLRPAALLVGQQRQGAGQSIHPLPALLQLPALRRYDGEIDNGIDDERAQLEDEREARHGATGDLCMRVYNIIC